MNTPLLRLTLLACCLLASCRSDGDQPTTVTGRPAISPARRLVARIREDADPSSKPATDDMVLLDQDTSTSLAVGDRLRVELKASSGTGYQWAFVSSNRDLAAADASLAPQFDWRKGEGRTEPLEPGKPGAPARWVFEFDAKHRGDITLHFALARPWEKGAKPADMRTLRVRVK